MSSPADLVRSLAARLGAETVVVGIGNPWRGDDALGCLVAGHLRGSMEEGAAGRGAPRPRFRVVDAEEVPESHLDRIVRPAPDTVVLVDAVDLGAAPGSLAVLEVEELRGRETSTHRTPLALLAHYIRQQSGADVFLLGIQPGGRELGAPPSDEGRQGARLAAEILEAAAVLAGLPDQGRHRAPCGRGGSPTCAGEASD